MFKDQSSASLSLEDLTSLSSISSTESTSIYSSNHSTVSSCNESRLLRKNKSLPQINYDLENIFTTSSCSPSPTVVQSSSSSSSSSSTSSLTALINQRLRQKMKMFNIHPDNLRKSYKKVTFNSEQQNGQTVNIGIVKEIISNKKSISHKLPTINNMETSEVKKIANDKSSTLKSMKTPDESGTVNQSDISSVSSIEIAPATIKQFKYMIEKQKSYLDCLQRELNRLQRMEAALSELHYKSKLQKRVINDLTITNCCCDGNCKNYTCQSTAKQANESHQQLNPIKINVNPSKSKSDPVEDSTEHSSEISVESVMSIVTPSNQTSCITCPSEISPSSVSKMTSKKDKMNSIHEQIDQMIYKLHEETIAKHSIGVQTYDSLIEPKKSSNPQSTTATTTITTTIKKNDNNKLIKPSSRKTQEKSMAWTVTVSEGNSIAGKNKNNKKSQAYYIGYEDDEPELTLQQAFRSKCGHFLARSQSRVQGINIASAIRKATAESRLERQLEEFLKLNQLQRHDYNYLNGYKSIKVQVIKPRKIFTEKEMKQQTLRLYSHLPEIKKLREEKIRQENVKTYRLMAKNFSQQLKSKAVNGRITFPLTQRLTN